MDIEFSTQEDDFDRVKVTSGVLKSTPKQVFIVQNQFTFRFNSFKCDFHTVKLILVEQNMFWSDLRR